MSLPSNLKQLSIVDFYLLWVPSEGVTGYVEYLRLRTEHIPLQLLFNIKN